MVQYISKGIRLTFVIYGQNNTIGMTIIIHGRLARWIKWRACDVGEAKEGLENELWCRRSNGKVGEWVLLCVCVWALLILQTFLHFTYVTTHSPTLQSLYLRHNSFSNPSVASPMSTTFSNPYFASPTSQAIHLIHLASRPCATVSLQNSRGRFITIKESAYFLSILTDVK